ncbi:acetate--CoA ligase family protein [Actinomadura sp. SCN-SB]|uniref:acetate--CoA ligase family protein n=1 Tax=Actinomadura sp. SCN-SB TaxID=3373092 RepID=UPI003752D9C3
MTLDRLFRPRSVAVVGASSTPGKAGYAMMRALASFTGEVYPVNVRGGEVSGRPAYVSAEEIPGPVDLALLAVPAAAVPAALESCARAGTRAAVVCSGGFAETGDAGAALQDHVAAIARAHGMRILGPNTSGFVNAADGVPAGFLPAVAGLPAGPAAIVAQSGGVNLSLCFLAASEGLGISLGVGLGNAVDVDHADVLDHLAEDAGTRVVGLHIEGVTAGRALCEALARLTARKPVVALKVGRADVGDFAKSHTGALTGDFSLTRAALAQAGAVVVDGPTEMVDAMRALAAHRASPRRDPGVAVVTGQAGPGLIIADALRAAGVGVPELAAETVSGIARLLPPLTYQANPVDTGRPAETFGRVLAETAADPGIDVLAVYALEEPDAFDPVEAIREVREEANPPILFGSGGPGDALDRRQADLSAVNVPLYRSPDRVAQAVRALVADSQARFRLGTAPRSFAEPPPVRTIGPGPLDEYEAKELLSGAGVAVPEGRACDDREAAVRAFDQLGPPVVVKILDAALTHKSDQGGVVTGVGSRAELIDALDTVDALADRLGRPARYLVERQAPRGVELIVGGMRTPAFGPVVLLGVGGVDAELHPDPVLRLAPLSHADADAMVRELPRALASGHRGHRPVDAGAVRETLMTVARLLVSCGDLKEIEVNPLRLTPDGPLALDALAIVSPP